MAPRTLKLVVAYDGTPFVGWQRQAEGVSIQGLLEDCLGRIEGRAVTVIGAGRTDAGVHALAQVASCVLEHPIPLADLRRALNAMLPAQVRVRGIEEVGAGFHARFAARGKTYRYAILQGESASPFLQRYVWHVSLSLNVAAMAAAARLLEGTHDFAAFQSAGSSAKTSTRTIVASRVVEVRSVQVLSPPQGDQAGGGVDSSFRQVLGAGDASSRLILYDVSGDGFLRHMVRAIAGSLVEVGAGRRDAAWLGRLLAGCGRDAAGPTAPACGLWLADVHY